MKPLSFGWNLAAATVVILAVVHAPAIDYATVGTADALRTTLAALLTATVLLFVLTFSRWSGWAALAGTLALYWGVSSLNTVVEAVFFKLDLGSGGAGQLLLSTFLTAGVVSMALTLLSGRWTDPAADPAPWSPPKWGPAGWAWRAFAVAFAYFVCYFIAGMLVFPFVKSFYEGRVMPGPGELLAMQIGRGLVYAGVATVLMRMLVTTRRVTMLTVAAAFSILGGIAPLLPPNPFMPADIRWMHMIEIGVSNFVFGLAATRLLGGRRDVGGE